MNWGKTSLRVNNLTVSFQEPVVKGVSLEVFPGKTTAIVGESGSGKTILSMAIMGLLPNSARIETGEVKGLAGEVWANAACERGAPVGREISMVFQDPMSSLNPSMIVGEQVAEPLLIHEKITKEECKERVLNLFKEVELSDPEIAYEKFPHELSGGQKQRIMIAMALACDPKILIADEPTTALDVTVQDTILKLLQRLQKKRNLGVLFISHDLDVVRDIADYVLVMRYGEVMEQGACKQVLCAPGHEYTKELLASRPKRGDDSENGEKEDEKILIEARGVCLDYVTDKNWLGNASEFFSAVKDVTFNIKSGERVGLVGESGSGKSSLGKVLLGMEPVSSGEVLWKGKVIDFTDRSSLQNFRRSAQPVFQDPFSALNPRMKIGATLAEAIMVRGGVDDIEIKVSDLLKEVGLDESDAEKYPGSFSGGQRQRIVLARALAIEPEFLVLDESVAALDLRIQAEILNLLSEIQKERDLAFLFISHDLTVIEAICDRVLIMKSGEIVEEAETQTLFSNPKNPYTKRLLKSRPGLQEIRN